MSDANPFPCQNACYSNERLSLCLSFHFNILILLFLYLRWYREREYNALKHISEHHKCARSSVFFINTPRLGTFMMFHNDFLFLNHNDVLQHEDMGEGAEL